MAVAQLYGCSEVRTEHVLAGVCAQKKSVGGRALATAGATEEAVKKALEDSAKTSPSDLKRLEKMFNSGLAKAGASGAPAELPLAQETLEVLADAGELGASVTTKEVVRAALRFESGGAHKMLVQMEVDMQYVDVLLDKEEDEKQPVGAGKLRRPRVKSVLEECGVDLTKEAREGRLDPVIGRDEEVERMMRVLVRRRKSNPCLTGDPGVGKTAVAEAIALRIVDADVPKRLLDKKVISLQLGLLLADTKYRGEFEARLKNLLEEVKEAGDIILFIDEIHMLVGAGAAGDEGSMDAANLLKPALARGELQCIGATTVDEYRRYIEKDPALERRFQPVSIDEPSKADTEDILRGIVAKYASHHEVAYTDEAIVAAVQYSVRYINDRFLPDKAIDLVDEAGAMLQMEVYQLERAGDSAASAGRRVEERHVASVVSQWTGVPVNKLSTSDAAALLTLEAQMAERVVGQHQAVKALARAIRRARSGLSSSQRPLASLLFAGPTGVGKSELVKAIAECYYGSEDNMVRLDMSEYMEAQAVSRLVGPPPGYVGYEEGGQLTDAVRRTPYTVVLLDEMEKAHADVFNVLLQVLEDGRLTDSKGRTVDFTSTVIVMTSNVGSGAILETVRAAADGSSSEEEVYAATATAVREELLSRYRPEFLNRMDEIITFRPLVEDELQSIASIMLAGVAQRVQAACGSTLEVGPALRARICSEGFSPSFGARPLRRAVQRLVEDVAAEALLSGMGGAQDDVILFECGSAAGGDTSMVVASCGSKERLEVRVQADSTGIEAMGTDGTAAAQAADARSEFQAAMSDAAAALGMPEPGSAFN
eukprot:PRCOL_00004540-RA